MTFNATNKIRYVRRRNGISGNPVYLIVLQQWWQNGVKGEWRDVPEGMVQKAIKHADR